MTPAAGPDDASLVRASLQGDQEAFAVLISRHAPSVFSVTTRMLGLAADAEDVAQDTFVSAYKALPRFQFESKFSTWLYRIAVNKCTDVLRARRPGHAISPPSGESSETCPGRLARSTSVHLLTAMR
jgi:RNA polymerase sigma-70 factor (ECF subfamily)